MLPRDAFFAPKETVPVGQAVGRICAEQITRTRPGIPVIIPGSALPPSSWTTCAAASARACSSPDAADPALDTISVVSRR
jgi:arginine decarboxylase